MSDEATIKLKAKYKHFRALIVGRSNAGKTTILKTVCNSTENPRIYDSEGNERDASIVSPTSERGEHDINDELVFSSNEGFVFHDSRGFEAGSVGEVEIVKRFVEERANATSLDGQLHAIWYCIPVDNARLLTAAELEFFDKCDPKGVPVIVIFTKFDSRDAAAYDRLLSSGLSPEQVEAGFQQAAEDEFNEVELPRIRTRTFPPRRTVFLRDMNVEGASCANLIEQTTGALDTDALKMLLVSVQRTNLNLCMKYALGSARQLSCIKDAARAGSFENKTLRVLLSSTLVWYPHTWSDFIYENDRPPFALMFIDIIRPYMHLIKSHLPALTQYCGCPANSNTSPLLPFLNVCCAILINLEYSFSTESDKPTHKKFGQSLQDYVRSDSLIKVRKALLEVFGNATDICTDVSCQEHYPPNPPPVSPPLRNGSRLLELLHEILRRSDATAPILVESGSTGRPPCHADRAFSQDDMMRLCPIVVDNLLPRPAASQPRNRRMQFKFSYFCL